MVKKSNAPVAILILAAYLCACSNKNTSKDSRCPVLVEKAESFNAQTANGTKEGPMGIKMSVEYVDTVYRVIQIVDENLIPAEKIKMFLGNMKQNMVASVSSSSGSERYTFQQMVDYRVTFEHIVKSKGSGNVICRNIMTPEDIAEALEKQLTPLDELKTNVDMQKGTLPRVIEAGYTMTDISCPDDIVQITILIDENQKEFDEATKIRTWSKAEQAVTLADLTTGLTFWSVAAQVPAKFDFHYVGSKGKNELHIKFSTNEVVEYNKVMDRIKEQLY